MAATSIRAFPVHPREVLRPVPVAPQPHYDVEEILRVRRMRSLLALFGLYAFALLSVMMISDGADIGCILAGIAGHVLWATHRMIVTWRDAAWIEHMRARAYR